MWFTIVFIFTTLAASPALYLKRIRQEALEDRIPFTSSIFPPFPRLIPNLYSAVSNGSQRIVKFSIHEIRITFRNCSGNYAWRGDERVIIHANKFRLPYIFSMIKGNSLPYSWSGEGCQYTYLANVPFALDGFPLMIIYSLDEKEAVENSYMIKYVLAHVQIMFDKHIYNNRDRMTVSCVTIFPNMDMLGKLEMIPPVNHFVEISRTVLANGFILRVEGVIFFNQIPMDFVCKLDALEVRKSPLFFRSVLHALMTRYNISRTALCICLMICLIILIFLGVVALIIMRKEKLVFDMTAYYTEIVEDKVVRFTNPIINNLTSPLRKYRLPGALTSYQLRRNFNRLISVLLSKFPKSVSRQFFGTNVAGDEEGLLHMDGKILVTFDGRPLAAPSGKCALSIGPVPQETPGRWSQSTRKASLLQQISGAQRLKKYDSDESLDRHVIGTLPYTRLVAQKNPYWLSQETKIPIKVGVSNEAATFQPREMS